jgi:predicted nuclease of predicted toxin-antitoxin system
MNLYLDDDSVDALLVRLLLAAGHAVQTPTQINLSGEHDVIHFMHAIRAGYVLLTHNHDDFKRLHELVLLATGHHSGILVVRRDNDPRRDLRPRGIARAVDSLLASGVSIPDQFHILNHWR